MSSSSKRRRSQPAQHRALDVARASTSGLNTEHLLSLSPKDSPASKPGKKDYLLSKDQSIEGATLESAVELLSSSVIPASAGFLYEFLMTYRSFTTPAGLFGWLKKRLTTHEVQGSDLALVRLRVVNIFKNWINHCPQDWESPELPALFEGVLATAAQEDAVLLKHLEPLRQLISRVRESSTVAPRSHVPKITLPLYRVQNQLKTIKETSAQVLAEQFTIIDIENLEGIAPWDLIQWSRINPSDREIKCPNLYRLVDRYYEIGHFVATTIASEPEVNDRVKIILKFLDVAKAANDLGNFNLLMAVYSGVTHPVLKRLKTTWLNVPSERLKQLNSFIKYCDPEDNYDAMRTYIELTSSARPCLPFLGGYIAEMIHIHAMSSDYLPAISSQGERLINYAKHRKLYTIISAIKRCDYKLPVKRKEAVLNMIRRLHALPTDGLKMKVSDWQEASSFDPLEESSQGTEFGFDAVATPRYPVLGATLGEDRTEEPSTTSEDDDDDDYDYQEDTTGEELEGAFGVGTKYDSRDRNNHYLEGNGNTAERGGNSGDENAAMTTPTGAKNLRHSGGHHFQQLQREDDSSDDSLADEEGTAQQQQHQHQHTKKKGKKRGSTSGRHQAVNRQASSPHGASSHSPHVKTPHGEVKDAAQQAAQNRGSSTPNTSRTPHKKNVAKSRSTGAFSQVSKSKRVRDDAGGTASSSGDSVVYLLGPGQSGTVSGSGHFKAKINASDPSLERRLGPRAPSNGSTENATSPPGSDHHHSPHSQPTTPNSAHHHKSPHTPSDHEGQRGEGPSNSPTRTAPSVITTSATPRTTSTPISVKKNAQAVMKSSAEIDWDEEMQQAMVNAAGVVPGSSLGSHTHLYQSGGGHVSTGTSPKESHFHIVSPTLTAMKRGISTGEIPPLGGFHQLNAANMTTSAMYADMSAHLAGESDSPPSPTTSSSPPRAQPMTRQNSRTTNPSPIRRNTPTGYLTNPGSARSGGKASGLLPGSGNAGAGTPSSLTHHVSSGSLGPIPGSPVAATLLNSSAGVLLPPSAGSSVSGMSVASGGSGGAAAAAGNAQQNASTSLAELKLDTKRYEIALELLETEEHFVHYLKILVEDGVYPLRQKMQKFAAAAASATTPQSPNQPDPTTPLNEAHIRIIFSNIEALYSFHSLFLEDLHNAVRYWRSGGLGSLFSQYHHGFESYVEYTNSRHRGDMLLELMLAMNSSAPCPTIRPRTDPVSSSSSTTTPNPTAEYQSACRLLQRQQEVILSKTGNANFMALLHLPVHRLPRILILLKEFKGCTHEGHPDLAILVDAISKLEHIAKKLPMTKEDAEQSMMQLQVLNKIAGWKEKRRKLRPGRNFHGEFELKLLIQGTNRFPKLTALVWSDSIFFCRTKESKMTRKRKWAVLGILKMSHIQLSMLSQKQARNKLRDLTKEVAKSSGHTEQKTQISWTKHPSVIELKYLGLEWLLSFASADLGESFMNLAVRSKEAAADLYATTLHSEPSPAACESAAIATIGSKVYMFGGAFKGQWRNDLWSWDMNNRAWTKIQTSGDPPLARTEHAMCSVGNRLYLHGGQRFGSYIDDLMMFDTETCVWSAVDVRVLSPTSNSAVAGVIPNKTPTPRSGHSLVAIGTKLYLFGGQWFESLHQRHLFNDLFCFDTETNSWSELVPQQNAFAPAPRQRHVAQTIDKKLIVFGGSGISSELSDIVCYDPAVNRWKSCSEVYGDTPTNRALAGSAVFGKKLIIFGGCSETRQSSNPSNAAPIIDTYSDMFVFDIEAMKWSHCWVPLELLPRRGHSIVATSANDNTLVIFCGRVVNPDTGDSDPTSDVVLVHGLSSIINNFVGRAAKIEKLRARVEKLSSFAIQHQALLTVVGSHYVTPPSSEGVKWDPLTTKSTFSLLENLGSLVYKAVHEPTQSLVAIKVLSHHDCSLEMLDIMAEEMQILSRCRHPGLTAYHGFAPVSSELWIVSEFTMGTSLDRLKSDSTPLSEKQVASILVTVLESLAYLHSQSIVFKGIKAPNIILNSDGRIKLTDWGLSPIWKPFNNALVPKNAATMAPELVSSSGDVSLDPTYTAATDIYELGLMVVGLLEPYGPGRQLRTRHKFSAEVLDFVALCTASFPHRRPTAVQLLSHPFILPHLQNALRDDVLRTLYADAIARRPARASSLLQGVSFTSGTGAANSPATHERTPLDHRVSSGGTPLGAQGVNSSSPALTTPTTARKLSAVKIEEISLLRSTVEALKLDHAAEKEKLNQQILALQQQNSSLESRLRAIELLVSNLVIPSRP